MRLLSSLVEHQQVTAHIDDFSGKMKIQKQLLDIFICAKERPAVIMCIGTDRATGDTLGPMVGTRLSKFRLPELHIYGTLDNPVHAKNLEENILAIQKKFDGPFVVAVDACLGCFDSIGNITLADGPLRPGAGVHKQLPEVGDVHLMGIVNMGGFMPNMALQSTRLNIVWKMSEILSYMIYGAYSRAKKQ